jgi:predicted ATP-grasp superfamily ATP-dependent carboligase
VLLHAAAAASFGDFAVVLAASHKATAVVDRRPIRATLRRGSKTCSAALGWRGPCELEVLRDPQGNLNIIEINPRFPAWVDLTAGAGQNLPALCVQGALGHELQPAPPYKTGTAFVRISLDQIVPIEALAGLVAVGERLEVSE